MAKLDFKAQWNLIKAFLESSNATELTALMPARPPVKRGQIEQFEELIQQRLVVIDMSGSDQAREQAAAQNTHQTWNAGFRVYAAARGATMEAADDACLELVSAIANDFAGAGGFAGSDRTTLIRATVDRWSWDDGLGDDLISVAFVDITGTFYRTG